MSKAKSINTQSGAWHNLTKNFRLILRLMGDRRVSPFLKLLPIGSVVYFISPLDIVIPLLDDLMVLWLANYMFLELCPPEVVKEHRDALEQVVSGQWRDAPEASGNPDVLDAEFKEEEPSSE